MRAYSWCCKILTKAGNEWLSEFWDFERGKEGGSHGLRKTYMFLDFPFQFLPQIRCEIYLTGRFTGREVYWEGGLLTGRYTDRKVYRHGGNWQRFIDREVYWRGGLLTEVYWHVSYRSPLVWVRLGRWWAGSGVLGRDVGRAACDNRLNLVTTGTKTAETQTKIERELELHETITNYWLYLLRLISILTVTTQKRCRHGLLCSSVIAFAFTAEMWIADIKMLIFFVFFLM